MPRVLNLEFVSLKEPLHDLGVPFEIFEPEELKPHYMDDQVRRLRLNFPLTWRLVVTESAVRTCKYGADIVCFVRQLPWTRGDVVMPVAPIPTRYLDLIVS